MELNHRVAQLEGQLAGYSAEHLRQIERLSLAMRDLAVALCERIDRD